MEKLCSWFFRLKLGEGYIFAKKFCCGPTYDRIHGPLMAGGPKKYQNNEFHVDWLCGGGRCEVIFESNRTAIVDNVFGVKISKFIAERLTRQDTN